MRHLRLLNLTGILRHPIVRGDMSKQRSTRQAPAAAKRLALARQTLRDLSPAAGRPVRGGAALPGTNESRKATCSRGAAC